MPKKQKSHFVKKYNYSEDSYILNDIDRELKLGISLFLVLWSDGRNCLDFSQYYIIFQSQLNEISSTDYNYFLSSIREINDMIKMRKFGPLNLKHIDNKCVELYNMIDNDTENSKNTYR